MTNAENAAEDVQKTTRIRRSRLCDCVTIPYCKRLTPRRQQSAIPRKKKGEPWLNKVDARYAAFTAKNQRICGTFSQLRSAQAEPANATSILGRRFSPPMSSFSPNKPKYAAPTITSGINSVCNNTQAIQTATAGTRSTASVISRGITKMQAVTPAAKTLIKTGFLATRSVPKRFFVSCVSDKVSDFAVAGRVTHSDFRRNSALLPPGRDPSDRRHSVSPSRANCYDFPA